MSYKFKSLTIRTDNSEEGIKCISSLWDDIFSKKIVMETKNLMSEYSNYESNQNGKYDFTIMTINNDFIKTLEESLNKGDYLKYSIDGKTPEESSKRAWEKIWRDYKQKKIHRAFSKDFEISFPSKNGFCTEIYISIK